MCARFTLKSTADEIVEAFEFDDDDAHEFAQRHTPRYNIAPSQLSLIVVQQVARRRPAWASWGLIPSWAKDASIAHRTINARSESASLKPSFRDAMRSRRCLVPTDGFFEWRGAGRQRQPMYFTLKSQQLMAFAGLWETWRDTTGHERVTFTVLTTTPSADIDDVHDRMPVILPRESWADWCDPTQPAEPLLRPLEAGRLQRWDVDPRMNSPRVDGPLCVQPLLTLF